MPIDGSRLNAHKHRTADMRRRKESNKELAKIFSRPLDDVYDFKKISPSEIEEIKTKIRAKSKLQRRRNTLFISISIVIGLLSFIYLLKRLNIY